MINKLVEDINKALDNEAYFSALSLALTLPDICGKAEFPETKSGRRYIDWYDEHIGKYEKYPCEQCKTQPTIEINMTDSSSGMTSAAEGVCDIGMASREVKQSELDKGLVSTTIATDGIAVIVNNENTYDDLTADQVRRIYIGEITTWSALEE